MRLIFLITIGLFTIKCGFTQIVKTSKAIIGETTYSMNGTNKILITYNILGAKSHELFNIKVVITDSIDQQINASSLSGDLENVSTVANKKILWSFLRDLPNYSTGLINNSNISQNFKISLIITQANPKIIPYTSKVKALAFSTLYPGAGSARISQNKMHLIKGLAAYSCIAFSIKYNQDGIKAYKSYLEEDDGLKRNEYVEQALEYQQMSNYFAYGAIAIWAFDYVNIIVMENKTNNKGVKISFNPIIQPQIQGGIISLAYNF